MEPKLTPQGTVGAEQAVVKKESFLSPLNKVTLLSKITALVTIIGLTIAGFLYGYQFGLDEKISLSTQAVDLNMVSSTTNQTLEQKYIEDGVVSYKAQPGDVLRAIKYIVKNHNLYYLDDSQESLGETLLVEGVTYVAAFGDNVVHANGKLFAKDQLIEDTVVLKDLNGYGNRLVSDTKIYYNEEDKFFALYENVEGQNLKALSEFSDRDSVNFLTPIVDGGYWAQLFTDNKSLYCLRTETPLKTLQMPVEVVFTPVVVNDQFQTQINVAGIDYDLWAKGVSTDAKRGYVTLKEVSSGKAYQTNCEEIK